MWGILAHHKMVWRNAKKEKVQFAMSRLLYVEASPRKDRSVSSNAASAFLEAYQQANTSDTVDHLDIWSPDLPALDQDALDAKYAGLSGQDRTPPQEAAWQKLKSYADRFRAADKILISVPMWNFGIPYRLKQLIDVVSHKDLLFTFDERGLNGLLTNSKALVIYARGISYETGGMTPAPEWDHQKPYLELWLKFIGVPDVSSLVIEKTLMGDELDAACKNARTLAASF